MSDLESRLRGVFSERSARRLARVAPATLLAAGCGAALGALLAAPGFAASAAGVVIGGIAVNITSSWIEKLFTLPLEDEDGRAELIEQGLAANDAATQAVVAATLAAAGPDVARALPADGRAELIGGIERGMQDAGGALAALAPTYAAALRAPEQADWNAVRVAAQQQISARVEAGERAVIERSGITIEDTDANVDASVIAGTDGTIKDSGISIRGARSSTPEPSTPAPLPPPVPSPADVHMSIAAGSGGSIEQVLQAYIQQLHLNLPDHEARKSAEDLLAYLRRTLHDCNALPLGKIDQTDAAHARPMELARVYIALNTTSQVEMNEDERRNSRGREQRPLSVVEALGNKRVMLLGAPGSGKSTFASHLTYSLAGIALEGLAGKTDIDWNQRLPGWTYGALLPVPIVLRDFAASQAVATARVGTVKLVSDFLTEHLATLGCPGAATPLLAALRDGKALLLLDGLDEVVGDTVLPRVAEAIIDAEKNFPGPILATCRVLDYQEERQRQLPGFAVHTLAELDEQQINTFIAAWYSELANSGRRTAAQGTSDASEMQGAVQSRDELRALAGTPLLLTLMAQVHAFRGTLPDARALLYHACIDLLLLRWRQPRDEPDLIDRLGLSRFRSSDLLALMARLGYEAHTRAERDQHTSGPADLDEATLMAVLADVFEAYDKEHRFQLAEVVLRALSRGNGLLLQRGPKQYTFAHRTFQEFLAGYHLKGLRNAQQLCRERAGQPHWHEALLLMVGYQVLGENELDKPLTLAEKLLAASPLEQALGGDILALVGRERALSFDAALVAAGGLWPTAIRTLRHVQVRGEVPDVPATLRNRIGLALGRLCYGELKDLAAPGGKPPAPDPRLPFAVAGSARSDGWQQALAHYWCPIEAGPFWSGDDRTPDGGHEEDSNLLRRAIVSFQQKAEQQGPLRQAVIDTPYQIARHPVTNADYARFLAANGPDGYDFSKPWWTEEGRRYLLPGGYRFAGEPEQITYPRYWTVARYNNPLQPVVGVSWYEAAAYCRWLTDEGRAAGWLLRDQEIRLPSWYEWERSARHIDTRPYPWGTAQPDPERANYADTGLGASAPIGCLHRGTAACGAQDMVGNMFEWSASLWQKWDKEQKGFTDNDTITVSWTYSGSSTDELKCGARSGNIPYNWVNYQGFRLVLSPSRSV